MARGGPEHIAIILSRVLDRIVILPPLEPTSDAEPARAHVSAGPHSDTVAAQVAVSAGGVRAPGMGP